VQVFTFLCLGLADGIPKPVRPFKTSLALRDDLQAVLPSVFAVDCAVQLEDIPFATEAAPPLELLEQADTFGEAIAQYWCNLADVNTLLLRGYAADNLCRVVAFHGSFLHVAVRAYCTCDALFVAQSVLVHSVLKR
jgi:hypothetical protein